MSAVWSVWPRANPYTSLLEAAVRDDGGYKEPSVATDLVFGPLTPNPSSGYPAYWYFLLMMG